MEERNTNNLNHNHPVNISFNFSQGKPRSRRTSKAASRSEPEEPRMIMDTLNVPNLPDKAPYSGFNELVHIFILVLLWLTFAGTILFIFMSLFVWGFSSAGSFAFTLAAPFVIGILIYIYIQRNKEDDLKQKQANALVFNLREQLNRRDLGLAAQNGPTSQRVQVLLPLIEQALTTDFVQADPKKIQILLYLRDYLYSLSDNQIEVAEYVLVNLQDFLDHYLNLEDSNLKTPESEKVKEELFEGISHTRAALGSVYTALMREELMNTEMVLEVYRNELRRDGYRIYTIKRQEK